MKILVISSLLGLLALSQPVDFSIDFRSIGRTTDEQWLAVPENGRMVLPPALPTKNASIIVTGLSFDRLAYKLGEEFDYEYRIRYAGAESITFPTSAESHLFRTSMSDLRVASLSIATESNLRGSVMQAVEVLYGASDVSGSLIVVNPNQTIMIRGRGRWRSGPRDSTLPTGWTAPFEPVVSMSVTITPTTAIYARSTVGPTIQLSLAPIQY